jgi:hypothetical protein
MKIELRDPPRQFLVGSSAIQLFHCADVRLEPDELLTFVTPDGSEYDVVCKDWGYYATPSLDNRLVEQGFLAALVRNRETQHYFIVLVRSSKIREWESYSHSENLEVLAWLHDGGFLESLGGGPRRN